jgi:hypothetical protein
MTDQQVQQLLDRQLDKFYGKYRGLVFDNQDPTKRGRIQAVVPEVLGTEHTTWAEPCTPYGGTTSGFYAIPPMGAGVWIEFEAGDVSRPVWVGCWWATGETPPGPDAALPDPFTKVLRTETGLHAALDDTGQSIVLSDIAGMNIMSIKVLEGTIEIKALAQVVLDAPLIKHGGGATHPAVFGDQLLAYLGQLVAAFNSHVHPGELALGLLPVTPMLPTPLAAPPTPALNSIQNLVQ